MIKVFKANDTNYTTNGEKIIKPISAIITKNTEEEYLELEAPLEYAEFLIQDNVLVVDTLTGKKGYRIHNPIISDVITVKAWLCYQEQVTPPADRGVVIAHGKNLANCKVEENWDNVVTKLIPVGYNDTTLPEGFISIPSPYQKVYERTIEFELPEELEEIVEQMEDEIEENRSLVASYENSVLVLTNKLPVYDSAISDLQTKITQQQQRLNELKSKPNPSEVELKEIAAIEATIPLLQSEIATYNEAKSDTEAALQQAQAELEAARELLEVSEASLTDLLVSDLRTQAQAYLNINKYPQINYDIEAHLEGIIEVGDTVRVKHPDMRVDLLTHVIEYKLDCLTLRFVNVQFGTQKPTLKSKFEEVDKKIEKAKGNTKKVDQKITKYASEYRRDDKELVSVFTSEIYGAQGGIFGLLEKNMSLFRQTASEISATVTRTSADLTTQVASLTIMADEIKSEVSQVDSRLNQEVASLTIRADQISSTVSRNYTDLNGKITQNTSLINQTASSIRSEVSLAINGVTQSISVVQQTANKINWLVKSGTSESNFTLTDRVATLVAQAINIDGYVKFTNLSQVNSQTTINGGNIKTGAIQSTNYQANVRGMRIDLDSGTIDSKNFKLKTDGSSEFTGSMTAGLIQSTNYSSNYRGMKIDLDAGTIDTKDFKVKTDGSAEFRGNITAGIIQSLNYSANYRGMKIDLNAGTIDTKDFKLLSDGSVKMSINKLYAGDYQAMSYSGNELFIGSDVSPFVTKVTVPAMIFKTTGNDAQFYSLRTVIGSSNAYASVGFFGAQGSARKSVPKLSTSATTTQIINKINELLSALNAYNLIYSV